MMRAVRAADRAGRRTATPVPVGDAAPDESRGRALARVTGALPLEPAAPAGTDLSGEITAPSAGGADAAGGRVTGAAGVLAVGAVVLGGIWVGVRNGIFRLDTAR